MSLFGFIWGHRIVKRGEAREKIFEISEKFNELRTNVLCLKQNQKKLEYKDFENYKIKIRKKINTIKLEIQIQRKTNNNKKELEIMNTLFENCIKYQTILTKY